MYYNIATASFLSLRISALSLRLPYCRHRQFFNFLNVLTRKTNDACLLLSVLAVLAPSLLFSPSPLYLSYPCNLQTSPQMPSLSFRLSLKLFVLESVSILFLMLPYHPMHIFPIIDHKRNFNKVLLMQN